MAEPDARASLDVWQTIDDLGTGNVERDTVTDWVYKMHPNKKGQEEFELMLKKVKGVSLVGWLGFNAQERSSSVASMDGIWGQG